MIRTVAARRRARPRPVAAVPHPSRSPRRGLLAVEGIVAARDPHFFPEQDVGAAPPATLLCFEAGPRRPRRDRVDGFVDRKVEALLAHRSQWRSTMGIDERPDEAAPRVRGRGRTTEARAAGIYARRYAPARPSPASTTSRRSRDPDAKRDPGEPGPLTRMPKTSALLGGALARRATSRTLRRRSLLLRGLAALLRRSLFLAALRLAGAFFASLLRGLAALLGRGPSWLPCACGAFFAAALLRGLRRFFASPSSRLPSASRSLPLRGRLLRGLALGRGLLGGPSLRCLLSRRHGHHLS